MRDRIRGLIIVLMFIAVGYAITWKTPSWTNQGYNLEYNSSKNNGVVVFSGEYDNGTKSANYSIDWSQGQKQKVTISGTNLEMTLTGLASNEVGNFILKIVQGDGDDTIDWTSGTVIKFAGGTEPTLSTTGSSIDLLSLYFDGTSWYGSIGLDFK